MSSIVEQVGRVIGGRYRLLAVVGAGASAQVFAADDTRLARRVAVKLLHPALAGDATFLRKFQAEARLAASLNHRNVLHVYDWGDEDGMPYLVLEYLGGGSLRSLLDTGRLLTPEQAASIGAQAAHGLAYAHRRGLVHRDIKPANLLFDDDGRLLVADFGLARALAEAAITEPLGTMMGTARYASPEQVEGHPVDDRTDVYSLALTLYESVTGRVPFAGETTAATLMARVGAVLPPARELGPLAPVLAQAAISEPLARLDAAALASELEMLLQELDPPEPLPLSRTDLELPSMPRGLDRDQTEQFRVAIAPPPAPPPATAQTQPAQTEPAQVPRPAQTQPMAWAPGPPPASPQATVPTQPIFTAPGPPPAASAPPQSPPLAAPATSRVAASPLPSVRRIDTKLEAVAAEPPRQRRRRRWLPWLLVVLLLEVAAGAGFLVSRHKAPHRATVPRVVGLQVLAARSALHKAGLTPEIAAAQFSGLVAPGAIISQTPATGAREKPGSIVKMTVSEGRHPTTLPSLPVGMTKASARGVLKKAHLVAHFSKLFSETVPAGTVVSWSSVAGDRVFYGDTVDVVISKGPAPQTIPSDLGAGVLDWSQAQSVLYGLHLVPEEATQYSSSIPAGYVVSTDPPPGRLVPGHSQVTVVVSIGPPYVKVPSLFSDSVSTAEGKLSSLGLKWQLYGPPGANYVLTQLPSANTSERVGSTVELFLY